MTTESVTRANALVAKLRAVGIGASIAGGYARDSLYGRPIKDVDLFIEVGDDPSQIGGLVPIIERVFGTTLSKRSGLTAEEYDIQSSGSGYVHRVDSGPTCVLGLPIDVMYVDDISARIERFPDHLSRVELDGTTVIQDPESLADYMAQRITYTVTLHSVGHKARLSRLLEKYEGFTVA